eukprot:6531723-Prorocentrum_lima.AAC.1
MDYAMKVQQSDMAAAMGLYVEVEVDVPIETWHQSLRHFSGPRSKFGERARSRYGLSFMFQGPQLE